MDISALKTIGTVYLVGGVAFGAWLEPMLTQKKPLSPGLYWGVLTVAVLLLVFNVRMYLAAARPDDAEFPRTGFVKWYRPIFATAAFVVGAGIIIGIVKS